MGKGVERGSKRVYTFTLDQNEDSLMIKWLETQSTTAVVKEGLKLVMSGGSTVGEVSKVQSDSEIINSLNQQNTKLLNLVELLTNQLTNNAAAGVSRPNNPQQVIQPHQQIQETLNQQAVTIDQDKESVKEEKEEFDKEALEFADKQMERFESGDVDFTSFGI